MTVRTVAMTITAAWLAVFWGVASCSGAAFSIDGQTIADAAGRRISVSVPFKRIISLYGAHTENLFAMGAGPQLIGVTRNEDWPPEAKHKAVYSYHDDVEKFLAARPDLVLVRPMIDRGYGRLLERLEANGIAVASLQPATVDQMFLYWAVLGRLCGCREQARKMVEQFQRTAERIRLRTTAIPDKKRVYFEAIHDRMRTFAPTAMAIFALESAGGINVAHDAVPRRGTNIADYGKERILACGDDIDLYLAQSGPMNRPTLGLIKSEPGYHLIRAVRQDQIYFIDEKLVSRPTMRMLDGMCRIVQILYPHLFTAEAETFGCSRRAVAGAGQRMPKEKQP
jgi:iron complex transport system substrate-binding protein